jgi:hypothetical protein
MADMPACRIKAKGLAHTICTVNFKTGHGHLMAEMPACRIFNKKDGIYNVRLGFRGKDLEACLPDATACRGQAHTANNMQNFSQSESTSCVGRASLNANRVRASHGCDTQMHVAACAPDGKDARQQWGPSTQQGEGRIQEQ